MGEEALQSLVQSTYLWLLNSKSGKGETWTEARGKQMGKRVGKISRKKDGRCKWASQRKADRQSGGDGCCRETAVLAEPWLLLPYELAGIGGSMRKQPSKPPCWSISATTHYPYSHCILWSCSDTLFLWSICTEWVISHSLGRSHRHSNDTHTHTGWSNNKSPDKVLHPFLTSCGRQTLCIHNIICCY